MKQILLAGALLTLGCQTGPPPWLSVPGPTTKDGVEVVVDGVRRNAKRIKGVTGTATNLSGSPVTRCSLSFEASGIYGEALGMAHTSRVGLDVGETWEFEASFPSQLEDAKTISSPKIVVTR